MSEEVPEVVETPAPEPTLDDVYKEAGVDLQPQAPVSAPPPAPAYVPPQVPDVPDPYDADRFKQWAQQQQMGTAQTQDALRQLTGFLSQQQAKEAHAALQADLKSAVETVNEIVGHPKPKVIQAMIDAKAMEDPKFKQLWLNRNNGSAQQQHWNNALKSVARDFVKDLEYKVDPSLVAAQRARKESQKQMATTNSPKNETEEWEDLSLDEQERKYQSILNSSM